MGVTIDAETNRKKRSSSASSSVHEWRREAPWHALRRRMPSAGICLDVLIETILAALLVFSPWAFGVVDAWSEQVVLTLAAVLGLCLAARVAFRSSFAWTWAYLPLGAFLLLVVLQLLPLKAGFIGIVSPATVTTRTRLLGDLPGAADLLNRFTISFYPHATRHDLRLLLACTAVFATVLNVYRRPGAIKRLLVILALLGGAVGTLALAQDLTGADLIYWSVQTPIAPATAGPFVHYSHYSQFMNLCIGAALGLLLIRLQNGRGKASRVEATWSDEPRRHRSHRSGRSRRSRSQSADSATQPWLTWWLVATVLLGIGTVFLSFSRGGVISLLAAAAFTTVAVAIGRKIGFRSWLLTVLILAGVLGTFYIGFDTVYQRMATLGRFSVAAGSRWEMLTYLTAVWKQFPTLGTGMGTHEVVYPMFTRWTIAATATHAENEYAQVLEETGFSGLLLMLAFAAIVWGGYVRAVRGVRTAAIGAAAFGLGFGLLAVMVHSLGDFGQHLPANALMTSVSCALLLNLGHLASSSKQGKPNASPVSSGNPTEPTNAATQGASPASSGVAKPRSPRALSFTATIVALAAVTGVCLWALPAANQARLAEDSWRTAELAAAALRQRGWQGSDDEYANLITNAATASDLQPDNVKYQYWLNVYRWQSISRDQDPVTGQAQITLDDLSYVQRIITELHHARVLCPTFGPNLSVAGQLEKFVLDDPAGAAHIRSGYAISPCDPASCFAAGRLDAQDGHWEPATTEFARAIALDGSMFHPAAAVFLQAGRPDEAIALAGADENALRGIADMLEQSGQGPDLAARARQQAFALLQARCQSPDADASSLANLAGICFQKNDYPAAARYYRRAVDLQYDQSDWRYQLALSLEQTGKSVDALHEAQICLRLRPQWTEAQQLVEKLAAAVHSQ